MTNHNFTARDYAAQINGTTVITRAYKRENAVAYLQAKDKSLKAKDVYVYDGITGATTVDEVYSEEIVKWSNEERCNVMKDVFKVRMKEEYTSLV